jgi:hypothetical protein
VSNVSVGQTVETVLVEDLKRTTIVQYAGPFHLVVPESLAGRLPEAWRESEVVVSDRARVFTRKRMEIRLLAIPEPEGEGGAARAAPPLESRSGSGGVPPAGRLVAFRLRPHPEMGDLVQVSEQSRSQRDRRDDQRPGDQRVDETFGGQHGEPPSSRRDADRQAELMQSVIMSNDNLLRVR